MILPIGDTPNPRGFTPWVNWMLIAANVLVYLLATLPMSFTPVELSDPGVRELFDRVIRSVPPGTPPGDILAQLSAWDLFVEREEADGSKTVAFMDPQAVLRLARPGDLDSIAADARARLERVRDALRSAAA